MRILAGLSGGVDSSAAALLLKGEGHQIEGVTMSIWNENRSVEIKRHACYGPDEKEDIEEAEKLCRKLGIRHHVLDCAEEYKSTVLRYFREEYHDGRTPNPCIVCNEKIKFGVLLSSALAAGIEFDRFATGHYARISFDKISQRYILKKGLDEKKDQSYFLYRLSQQQLAKIIFPLGELTKEQTREICRKARLDVAEKAESQDFYSGDYRELLGSESSEGDVVSDDGKIIGKHCGLWNYTPGQRRGIGISSSKPLYVVSIDRKNNRVIVGGKDKIMRKEFLISQCSWISQKNPEDRFYATAKLRNSRAEIDAKIERAGDDLFSVKLGSDTGLIAPGQSAVFYDGDSVIGGGIIT